MKAQEALFAEWGLHKIHVVVGFEGEYHHQCIQSPDLDPYCDELNKAIAACIPSVQIPWGAGNATL
jgi:hypothetical protein